jgi:hypothetical protein
VAGARLMPAVTMAGIRVASTGAGMAVITDLAGQPAGAERR